MQCAHPLSLDFHTYPCWRRLSSRTKTAAGRLGGFTNLSSSDRVSIVACPSRNFVANMLVSRPALKPHTVQAMTFAIRKCKYPSSVISMSLSRNSEIAYRLYQSGSQRQLSNKLDRHSSNDYRGLASQAGKPHQAVWVRTMIQCQSMGRPFCSVKAVEHCLAIDNKDA
jgi:hypothetical protein